MAVALPPFDGMNDRAVEEVGCPGKAAGNLRQGFMPGGENDLQFLSGKSHGRYAAPRLGEEFRLAGKRITHGLQLLFADRTSDHGGKATL